MDVHYELVRLLSPSRLEVKREGRRAKNTLLNRLHIYSRPVRDENHVCQTHGRPLGAKAVTYIWRSRGRDCYQVPPCDVTTGCYITIAKPRSASLRSAIPLLACCGKLHHTYENLLVSSIWALTHMQERQMSNHVSGSGPCRVEPWFTSR